MSIERRDVMKINLKKIAVASLLTAGFFTVIASADVIKGNKILTKAIHSGCQMPATNLAMMHSQAEWKAIFESGKLGDEIKKACPKLGEFPTLSEKYTKDVLDFVEHYSNDSGAIPA